MGKKELSKILELHEKWLKNEEGGLRTDLEGADLIRANLEGANLERADLRGANLEGANLRGADLRGANLERADLRGANLEGANLRGADLRGANLEGANLIGANLEGANLIRANLRGANLEGANLIGANLEGANLIRANLRGADLIGANLIRANLIGANLERANLRRSNLEGANLIRANLRGAIFIGSVGYYLACPQKGSFIGFKKCKDNKIVELRILEDSKRLSATGRKCRCNKAEVISITNIKNIIQYNKAISKYDYNFIYEVGKIVEVKDFDEDRWNECSSGIHFFVTREEAVDYEL